MRRIGDMTMLLRTYTVLTRFPTMDLNELRAALKMNGVYTSAYKLWYLLGSPLAARFGIVADGLEYSVAKPIECPVVKRYSEMPKPTPTPSRGEVIIKGPSAPRPTAGQREARRAEKADEVLSFIRHAGRAPSQLGDKNERSLYQFMSEHRKRDPSFEAAVAPYVRSRKSSPKIEKDASFASMDGKAGSKDDVKLAMQLAESGGCGSF